MSPKIRNILLTFGSWCFMVNLFIHWIYISNFCFYISSRDKKVWSHTPLLLASSKALSPSSPTWQIPSWCPLSFLFLFLPLNFEMSSTAPPLAFLSVYHTRSLWNCSLSIQGFQCHLFADNFRMFVPTRFLSLASDLNLYLFISYRTILLGVPHPIKYVQNGITLSPKISSSTPLDHSQARHHWGAHQSWGWRLSSSPAFTSAPHY